MKKYFSLIILSLFLFSGCSKSIPVVDSQDNSLSSDDLLNLKQQQEELYNNSYSEEEYGVINKEEIIDTYEENNEKGLIETTEEYYQEDPDYVEVETIDIKPSTINEDSSVLINNSTGVVIEIPTGMEKLDEDNLKSLLGSEIIILNNDNNYSQEYFSCVDFALYNYNTGDYLSVFYDNISLLNLHDYSAEGYMDFTEDSYIENGIEGRNIKFDKKKIGEDIYTISYREFVSGNSISYQYEAFKLVNDTHVCKITYTMDDKISMSDFKNYLLY